MKRISASRIGIQQGSRVLFSDFADGGPMWTGNGPRESRFVVGFKEPFTDPPVVHIGLSLWDFDQKTNVRAELSAEKVTEKGFHIVFKTWSDTRVARVRADWLAIGAVRDEDDWDVV
jgi:hypothetical protein